MKVITFIIALILSFFLLIKGSIHLYQHNYHYATSIFLACSGVGIMNYLIFKLLSKKVKFGWTVFITYTLLSAYLIFCLYPRNEKNFKSNEIKKEYNDLHPLLRLGVGTLFLIDRNSIMTDGSRTLKDCEIMKINYLSDHRIHDDGYCYAIDISVRDRSEIRNFFVGLYFKIMGYYTLRHDQGFGDHYHISLRK